MATTARDHTEFLALLPGLERHARIYFRHLRPADREEAAADVVACGFATYLRLKCRGKDPTLFPVSFARFTARAVANGRAVGRRCDTRDAMTRTAQRHRGFAVHRFDDPIPGGTGWWRDVLADPRADVFAQAAFAVDFPAWLATLSTIKRRVAYLLARGDSTFDTAGLTGISPSRVSQLRRELAASWYAFHAGH